jgi:CheY-like chemotaxis protein
MLASRPELSVIGSAASGEDALELMRRGSLPDVLLLDLRMAGMNGVD